MVGMKEKLGEERYKEWYKRHRMVEQQRIWRIQNEQVFVPFLPEFEREMPPETYSLAQAFYHRIGCFCGSCQSDLAGIIKGIHVEYFKDEPWVKGASSQTPELPDQILRLLQGVEEAIQSNPDRLPRLQKPLD